MGDQYVSVNVVTLTGLNDKQKKPFKPLRKQVVMKVNQRKGFFDKVKDAFRWFIRMNEFPFE